ncbi:hypothetical protein C8J57DRAFT_1495591 [Mycena rebaudengoi]|nr:hypothetical protein C8J57DRAFT_1495591 [Mycena rebaudengoi]
MKLKRGFLKGTKANEKALGTDQKDSQSIAKKLAEVKLQDGKDEEKEKNEAGDKESDNRNGSEQDSAMTMTTLPGGADDRDPVTECLLFPDMKKSFTDLPDFPKPMTQPMVFVHVIRPTPANGLGMFTVRELKMGDLILSERPLFLGAEIALAEGQEAEKTLEACVARMGPKAKAAFFALANSRKDGPITGIIRTNGLRVDVQNGDVLPNGQTPPPESLCSPNVMLCFDKPSLSFKLFAVRDIAEDEELTRSYTPIEIPAKERQEQLAQYGFACTCGACSDAKISDARRMKIKDSKPYIFPWLMTHSQPNDWLIKRNLELIALIEEEGLQSSRMYADALKGTMDTYACIEDAVNASIYAKKLSKCLEEVERADVSQFETPAGAEAHPLWGYRRNHEQLMLSQLGVTADTTA